MEPGKSEEYLAWMRGRRSATDISWECLNAVRPEGTTSNSASVSGTIDALTLSGLVNATELTVATASGSSATLNLNSLSGLTSADLLPGKPEEGELPIMKSESASIINHQQKLSHSENLVDSITERQILLGLTTSVSIDSSAAVTGRSGLIAAGSGVLVGSVDGVSGSISSSRDLGNGTSIANGLELTGNQTTAATSLLSSHNSASAPTQTSSAEHQQLIAPGSAAVAQASLLEASTITVNLTASGLVEHSATHG
ncbi:unnamed protein product [Protopolystoma xenopodis]|uniref:Uncharacterized protein n=1 Tax=Protopolystoma xenopodis TaxID=117903 RepID=A0A3S5AF92_9PLAT|nr:unnamed protein product [Protopolystoma xenopodis]